MANTQIQAGFVVGNQVFATRQEAVDFLRKPQVEAALKVVAGGDMNLTKFLQDNEDEIMKAFEVGTIARVTKAEKKKLAASLEALKEVTGYPKIKFLQENADAILESFRWPAVKRMDEAEKARATMAALTQLVDEAAAKWIVDNRKQLEAAYAAGVEKRQPPTNGLQEYLDAKKAGPEALAAYTARKAAEKAAKASKAIA